MKVKPLYDRVLVKRIEEKEQKQGRDHHPGHGQGKADGRQGDRRRLRHGSRRTASAIPLEVKVGDTVLFGKYAGTEIKIDDVEHVILREDEVLGIIQ